MEDKNTIMGAGVFANLTYDETFKVIAGDPANERVLIDIIELFIPGKRIRSIERLDKEMHGFVISDKNITFDLLCKTDADELFIVEMQNGRMKHYCERVLAYSSYLVAGQLSGQLAQWLERKEDVPMDYSLMPVYVVSLLTEKLPHRSDEILEGGLISRYTVCSPLNGEPMSESLEFVFLELGRLVARPEEKDKCKTALERYAFSIKYMHTLKSIPEGFERDEKLLRLYRASAFAGMTQVQRLNYVNGMKGVFDEYARRQAAVEDARVEGAARRNVEIARAMLSDGLEADFVVKYSGLSLEEVKSLK